MDDEHRAPLGESWEYLDFEVEIRPNADQEHLVTVLHSPAGEAREVTQYILDDLVLENRLQAIQIALLRSATLHRQVLASNEQIVRDFGRDLFDKFIIGNVRVCYEISRREAVSQSKGLRLKLRFQQAELATLPWEFLYDDRRSEYVCLSRAVSIVRYLELPHPTQPLKVIPPVRILAMIASPRDLPALNIEREKRLMEVSIESLRARGLVQLTWLEPATWRDLQHAMRQGPWHIFHFVGHGGFNRNTDEGFIALPDDNNETYRLTASNLARLLADHESLRLVVLNACEGARVGKYDTFSSTAAVLVRRGLPAVLAMQYAITDQAAIEFTRAFYEALADRLPVDAATVEARKAISLAFTDDLEWGVPVLYMHTPDGKLFNFQGYGAEGKLQEFSQSLDDGLSQRKARVTRTPRKLRVWQSIYRRPWILIGLLVLLIGAALSFLTFSSNCISGLRIENWGTLNMPFNDVNQLVVNPKIPDTLYAGTLANGAFRSEDGGVTWYPVPIDLGETAITKITVDLTNPSIIYMATAKKGIFKSADNGSNWAPINNGLTVMDIRDIAVDVNDHNTIYIGTWGGGVFKSVDGGASWQQVSIGLSDLIVQALTIDANHNNILYAGTHSSGVFVTKDGANSWSQTSLQKANVRGLTISPRNSDLIFVSTWGDGVYITRDGGVQWNTSNVGITDFSLRSNVVADSQDNHILYVGSWSGGVFASVNEGNSWFSVNSAPKVVRVIAVNRDIVYIGARSGVYNFRRIRKTVLD